MTPEDLAAKESFIIAFFDDLEAKLAFTAELESGGHDDEARTLCSIYIEALGNGLFYPASTYAANFSRALIDHSGLQLFSVASPGLLIKNLPFGSTSPAVRAEIQAALDSRPANGGSDLIDLLLAIRPEVSPSAFAFLEAEGWRGTVASATYAAVRSPGAHWFGSPQDLEFSQTTLNGIALPPVTFSHLHQAGLAVMTHARGVSISSGMWFGRF